MKKTGNRKAYIVFSILTFIAGIVSIFVGIIIMVTKISDGDAKKILIALALILSLLYGIFEIIIGISSLSENRRPANQSGTVSLAKLAILFCVIQIIVSSFNGIMGWQLATVFASGILIPIIYLLVSKRGRVIRPSSRKGAYENRK